MIRLIGLGLWLLAATGDPMFWDTRIAGLELGDEVGGKAFVFRYHAVAHEPRADFPFFRCLNRSKTELLDLVLQYGGGPYDFMQFRVHAPSTRESASMKGSPIDGFVSGRGVRLGLAVEAVVALLGQPRRQREVQGELRLTYVCSSPRTCPGLKRINMPDYEATYRFRGGKLVAFEGGYPYP